MNCVLSARYARVGLFAFFFVAWSFVSVAQQVSTNNTNAMIVLTDADRRPAVSLNETGLPSSIRFFQVFSAFITRRSQMGGFSIAKLSPATRFLPSTTTANRQS
jgi:hypothetical protein